MLENEQGQTRGEGGSKLGNLERTYFLNVPFRNIYWQTKIHSLNTSCKAHNILQYGKILTKLLSFIFRIIKPLLSVFFNHCNLIVSAIYKASACKKFKNYRFETSLFFDLRKLIPLSQSKFSFRFTSHIAIIGHPFAV